MADDALPGIADAVVIRFGGVSLENPGTVVVGTVDVARGETPLPRGLVSKLFLGVIVELAGRSLIGLGVTVGWFDLLLEL